MSLPQIVTPEEWLAARRALLVKEKEHTQQRDALNAERRRLPMTEVTKDYRFEGADGEVSLASLFDGCSQLIIQHVMFGPDWDNVCPGCTASLNALPAAILAQLRTRDTAYAAVSRAPAAKIAGMKTAKGWAVDWYSSFGSDFNYDFQVTIDPAVTPPVHNYKPVEVNESTEVGGHSASWPTATRSSTLTRHMPAAPNRPSARMRCSTSRRSVGTRTGSSPRAG